MIAYAVDIVFCEGSGACASAILSAYYSFIRPALFGVESTDSGISSGAFGSGGVNSAGERIRVRLELKELGSDSN